MRKIIVVTFCFLFFSCNANQKNPSKWTEAEKDDLFKECIKFAMEIDNMNDEKANEYCYCSLDIIVKNFENKQMANKQIGLDNNLRLLWDETCR